MLSVFFLIKKYNMTGHEEKVLAVDWSIPQYLLSGGADNHLKIFQYSKIKVFKSHGKLLFEL
jgi:WD40 repeat protein